MKTLLIIFSLHIFNFACGQKRNDLDTVSVKSKINKERLNLKNAAFCTCLYKSFPKADSVFINEGSNAGYLELGAHSIDAFIKVMDVATEKAKVQYKSKGNKNLAIMKCLDFYNSKELDDLVKSLDKALSMEDLKKSK